MGIGQYRPRGAVFARIVAMVDTSGDGCWPWTGATTAKDYGRFAYGDDEPETTAHRALWIELFGEPPDGFQVCHHCDNPPCCRPDHWFLGTQAMNEWDKNSKGRGGDRRVFGVRNGRALLTPTAVEEIRAAPARRGMRVELAERYGVSKATISDVRGGRTWTPA